MLEVEIDSGSPNNRLKQGMEQLIALRTDILSFLEEAVSVVWSDAFFPNELLVRLTEGLSSLATLQEECFQLSGQPNFDDTTTMKDLYLWWEQLEEQTNAARLVEKANRIIEKFAGLVCTDDEIADEIRERQTNAKLLLSEDVPVEERIASAEKYGWVLQLLEQQQDEETIQVLYRAVKKEFGFVFKYALEHRFLRVNDVLSATEYVVGEPTTNVQKTRESGGTNQMIEYMLQNEQSDYDPRKSLLMVDDQELGKNEAGEHVVDEQPEQKKAIADGNEEFSDVLMKDVPHSVDIIAQYVLEWQKHKQLSRFSVSKFEEDLRQPPTNRGLAAFLLTYVRNYDVLAESRMNQEVLDPAESEEKTSVSSNELRFLTLRKLTQKGYLNAFTISGGEDGDTFYTLSEAGAEAFRKDTSRRFIQMHSKSKLIPRTEDSDPFMPGNMDDTDKTIVVAFQLRAMNRVMESLSRMLTKPIGMQESTVLYPFPYRKLRYQKKLRLLLLSTIFHPADSAAKLKHIHAIVAEHDALVPLVVVSSIDEGRYLSGILSTEEKPAYFALMDGNLLVGDASGQDCLPLVFGHEEVEERDETVDSESSYVSTVSTDKVLLEPQTSYPETALEPMGKPQLNSEPQPEIVTGISRSELRLMIDSALQLLVEERKAEGLMLLHTAAEHDEEAALLCGKVSHALGDPLRPTVDLFTLLDQPVTLAIHDCEALDDYLNAALTLRLFFEPDNANDYRLSLRWKQMVSNVSSTVLEKYPGIKKMAGFFHTFIERHQAGIKICASSAIRDELGIKHGIEVSRKLINDTIENIFPRNVKASIGFAKAHTLVQELYSTNGVLTNFLRNAFEMDLAELRKICQMFTEENLIVEQLNFDLKPIDSKLEAFLDRHWDEMSFKAKFGSNEPLKGAERNRQRSRLREAIQPLLMSYVYRYASERSGTTSIKPETVNKARMEACGLLNEVIYQLQNSDENGEKTGRYCLMQTLQQFLSILGDEAPQKDPFYASLLLNREMELDDQYLPILDDWMQDLPSVSGFRVWERILRHAKSPVIDWHEAAVQALRRYDIGHYDLIRSLPITFGNTEEWPDEEMVRETREQAKTMASRYKSDFMTEVESAQNYGQIASKDEMYGYFRLADAAGQHALQTQNIGFYKRLLDACREQIMRESDERMQATLASLEALKRDILQDPDRSDGETDEEVLASWPILDKISRMLEMRNMTVAEDYIQLADNGRGARNMHSMQPEDKDLLTLFYEQYQMLFQACNINKRDDLNRTYEQHVKRKLYPNQSNRNTLSAERFIKTWSKAANINEFMEQLLYPKIRKVERSPDNDAEFYIYPSPRDAKLGLYQHPFADFGTFAERRGVRVLLLAGVRTADNLLEEVAQYGAARGDATIVVLDYALPLAVRRQLAKSIKLRTMPETIVIVDRVMALFLAGYNQIERGDVLLKIALPFSKVQPYIPVGSIPPEMFIGRTNELDKIQSPNGPVFVYGGRQLGKTALLRESRNREHDPDKDQFALFIDLKQADSDKALQLISDELVSEKILQQRCSTWEDLKATLRARIGSKERPIRKLMLLLDEADVFILSCEKVNNRPLEILKELKDLFYDRFKFILAGLRDVVRFNKQRLGGNSVLAHLSHITIRPLEYLEARELLLRPLHYLGFRIQDQDEHLISLILAKTNYYPGLIHFYCQKLIETVGENYRRGAFSETTTPPYIIDERYLKTLLGRNDFLEEIENKFRITLQLDADDLYDILAKAMAYHYYIEGIGKGASVQDIKVICSDFGIEKINRLSEENVRALLEEMDELNIFRKETRNSGKYVFNRYSFFQMLGSDDKVFEQLINYGS